MRPSHLIRSLILVATTGATYLALADDDHEHESSHGNLSNKRNISVANNPTYKAECASCHMLYPPGLLPARSWQAIMAGLKDHFGENATLDQATTKKLAEFLSANAADHAAAPRSQKIAQSIAANDKPLRFTDTKYFKRQHHELSAKVWQRKAVGSPSNCVACHSRGEAGIFSEDEVRIPR